MEDLEVCVFSALTKCPLDLAVPVTMPHLPPVLQIPWRAKELEKE